MKTATENLENDHNYILQLTETMEKIAELGSPMLPIWKKLSI